MNFYRSFFKKHEEDPKGMEEAERKRLLELCDDGFINLINNTFDAFMQQCRQPLVLKDCTVVYQFGEQSYTGAIQGSEFLESDPFAHVVILIPNREIQIPDKFPGFCVYWDSDEYSFLPRFPAICSFMKRALGAEDARIIFRAHGFSGKLVVFEAFSEDRAIQIHFFAGESDIAGRLVRPEHDTLLH